MTKIQQVIEAMLYLYFLDISPYYYLHHWIHNKTKKKKQVQKTNTYHGVIFGPAVLQQYTEPFSSYLRMC